MLGRLVTAFCVATALLSAEAASAQTSAAAAPAILFEHRTEGPDPAAIVFSLAIFADGTVVFSGKNNTTTSGEARTTIPPDQAQRWIRALVDTGALDLREPAAFAPAPGADWSRLSIAAEGRANTYRFSHWNKANAFVHVLDLMLAELDVLNRWVRKPQ